MGGCESKPADKKAPAKQQQQQQQQKAAKPAQSKVSPTAAAKKEPEKPKDEAKPVAAPEPEKPKEEKKEEVKSEPPPQPQPPAEPEKPEEPAEEEPKPEEKKEEEPPAPPAQPEPENPKHEEPAAPEEKKEEAEEEKGEERQAEDQQQGEKEEEVAAPEPEEPAAPAPAEEEKKEEEQPQPPQESEPVPEPEPEPEPQKPRRKVRTVDLEGVRKMIGTDTKRYELGDKLGKGAYGIVVAAKNTETGEQVAVKRISKAQLAKEGDAGEKRLYREVAIMGSLNHPNLVNLKELLYKEDANEMWIVIELVKGCELMKKIDNETRLSEPLARKYFQQLVVGINYVHSQGVVHRDLKPENILVTEDDVCKITDFGLSNVQNTDTLGNVPMDLNVRTCCGTPYYVAPEVVTKNEGYSGFTADVWSLGIILFVMLVGDLPFTAKDLMSLLTKISRGDYQIPTTIQLSDEARDLIKKILTPKPAKRIKLLDIAAHPWFVKDGFDSQLLEVNDNVDKAAMDLLQSTMGAWGANKKEEEKKPSANAKTIALGRRGVSRKEYEENIKGMRAKK